MASASERRSWATLSAGVRSGDLSNHFGIIISADQPAALRPSVSMRTRRKACGACVTRATPKRKGKRKATGRSKASASTRRIGAALGHGSGEAVHREHALHADRRLLGVGEHARLVGEAEQLGEMLSERALCWPPIIAKWSCRPLR